ncbi:GntR family transcriptional regulator [Pediococcus pentosaceus]|uniref:GntR family transcriptional regulator n=1 Tax=Pediococcus pentosaceus TaxID=1255 RepID=UPI0013304A72|nr:GntR family transcriptional regulator [Pediococcus pentosaceus]KAF0507400.1 UTRA domain-containing protein [Pediococcus pentosaceus]MBF7139049.1 GntR family transcriptional regulator [Pediococcus pentosaceus]MCM6820551.1 GntR family transcriptional regulator [Pediococcus pentosaceus]
MGFNYNEKQPVYGQLVDELRKQIKNNYKPNDKLLSEREIMRKYEVSRNTVREALSELENIGYIYRQHGKGTFVASWMDDTTKIGDEYSFTEQMKSLGRKPETKIIEMSERKADEYFSGKLRINVGDSIIKLKRLRLADGMPMMIDRTYLPAEKFKNLSIYELETKQRSLYNVFLEDYGEKVRLADEMLSVGIISDKDADLLKIAPNSPGFMLRRTTYNHKNEIIEYTISSARGDQFVYNIKYKH